MSNVGTSPTLQPASNEISSHTSTQQWQSFEFRMRHRRAERCLLRAEIALEAGFDEDARAALEEAARLHSENPKLAVLRAELDARTASTLAAYQTAQQASRRQRSLRAVAVLLLFLGVGAAAFLITRMTAPVITVPPTDELAAAPAQRPLEQSAERVPQTAPIATAGTVDAPTAPLQEPIVEPAAPGAESGRMAKLPSENTAANPQQAPRRADPQMPAFSPQFEPPRPLSLPRSSTATEPAVVATAPASTAAPAPPPPLPEAPGATAVSAGSLDRLGERLPTSNAPAVDKPEPAAEKAAPAATERPAPPENPAVREEPRVRAVLARYEAAYSGLDAAAAQAVWPSVDGRSLARAFETLQSQRVSLGRCAVQVQGTTAIAACNGTMTWTPKVGGGSQTAARQWHFELHSGNGAWQITRADVR